MLIGALLVVSQSSYSDGDDAFFISIRTVWDLESICPGAIRPGWEECRGEAFVVSCIPARLGLLACGKCRAGASADGGAALVRKGGRDWCTQ